MVDLRQKREAKNLTQEELAEIVGVQRQAISAIECGIAKPAIANAKKLAEALDFEWSEFYEEETQSNVSE